MRFTRSHLASIAYELPVHVVTSSQIEDRLAPAYEALRVQPGSLVALTGIRERRWWVPGQSMADGAIRAGRRALDAAGVEPRDIGMLIYGGVCRDHLEPATACAVANGVGVGGSAQIYDLSNACLGVMNGILNVAQAIELGHVRAGLVVSCESARQIVELTIDRLNREPTHENFRLSLATFTGGSGAVAVVVRDCGSSDVRRRIVGAVVRSDPRYHELCRWGPDSGIPATSPQVMRTDGAGVLQFGVGLGLETWRDFRRELKWDDAPPAAGGGPDKIICHQVGAPHRDTVLAAIGMPPDRDFSTFAHLGNIGTVSLPITAAIAQERGFLNAGDRVGFLGIGSGLNCLMLGVNW